MNMMGGKKQPQDREGKKYFKKAQEKKKTQKETNDPKPNSTNYNIFTVHCAQKNNNGLLLSYSG